jgi:hypothetical protein
MSCSGRQKTKTFGLLALAERMLQQPFSRCKDTKKKAKKQVLALLFSNKRE